MVKKPIRPGLRSMLKVFLSLKIGKVVYRYLYGGSLEGIFNSNSDDVERLQSSVEMTHVVPSDPYRHPNRRLAVVSRAAPVLCFCLYAHSSAEPAPARPIHR